MIKHPIQPVFDKNSKILILGSFPSVKSREQNFFYGHPQNRFWRVLGAVYGESEPKTVLQRRDFLLSHGVAVWDVIGECEITGSADSSIRNATPNDLSVILSAADIKRIFVNGKAAEKYFNIYNKDKRATVLPSTSPANAAYSLERLIAAWTEIKNL